jgi:hypothetical protein
MADDKSKTTVKKIPAVVRPQALYQLRRYKFSGHNEILEVETDGSSKSVNVRLRITDQIGKGLTEWSDQYEVKQSASTFFGQLSKLGESAKLIQSIDDVWRDGWVSVQSSLLYKLVESYRDSLKQSIEEDQKLIEEAQARVKAKMDLLGDGDLGKAASPLTQTTARSTTSTKQTSTETPTTKKKVTSSPTSKN